MRQRVGFARALVVEPDALFMDEPFSALDVLTAENLRTELLSLWAQDDFPTRAMLIVTHNIEEAVLLADRVLVLSSNPGRIQAELVDRPRRAPATGAHPAFEALVDDIYRIMTGRDHDTPRRRHRATAAPPSPTEQPLPAATVGGMAGLLEIVVARGGEEDLPDLAHDLNFEVDDLLPLVDGAVMLGFATVDAADLTVTDDGHEFVTADILTTKELFAHQARERAPTRALDHQRARPRASTADSTPASSSTPSDAASPKKKPATNSTSPSTGAATANSSTTTPTPANSPSNQSPNPTQPH